MQRSKAYFISKFIANYVVTHDDMQDLADSTLFYNDDVGINSNSCALISPPFAVDPLDYSNKRVVVLPSFFNQNPVTFDCHSNSIISILIPTFFTNLQIFDCSNNGLTSLSISASCTALVSINASDNSLVTLLCDPTWHNLTSVKLTSNALSSAGIDEVIINIANSGAACAVDVSGGTNLSHALWSVPALAAETTIIANGGSVSSNP